MKCFIDGNQLCVVGDDFVNLQENKAVFILITKKQKDEINRMVFEYG